MRISDWSSDVCSSDLQAAEVAAPGQLDLLDYLGPGIDGVAAEARRRVRAGVDGGELHGAAETVERKRPRQRDHVATVDDAPAEAALALGMLVEVHARRVLRSEEHTSELQSLMRISYAVFCLKKKRNNERST